MKPFHLNVSSVSSVTSVTFPEKWTKHGETTSSANNSLAFSMGFLEVTGWTHRASTGGFRHIDRNVLALVRHRRIHRLKSHRSFSHQVATLRRWRDAGSEDQQSSEQAFPGATGKSNEELPSFQTKETPVFLSPLCQARSSANT